MSTRRTKSEAAESTEAVEVAESTVLVGAPLESAAIFGDENKAAGPDAETDVEITLAQHYGDNLPGDKVTVPAAKAEQLRLAGYATPA